MFSSQLSKCKVHNSSYYLLEKKKIGNTLFVVSSLLINDSKTHNVFVFYRILTGRSLKRDDPFKFPMLPPRNCYMIKFTVVSMRSRKKQTKKTAQV